MLQSICVVYERARFARDASRSLARSAFGTKSTSVRVHYRRMIDGKLTFSQTRPGAGALMGALSMAAFGGVVAMVFLGFGEAPMLGVGTSLLLGGLFGGLFGGLAGAIIGTTEPAKPLADAEALLVDGRAAVVAEFGDSEVAGAAKRMLMRLRGAHLER